MTEKEALALAAEHLSSHRCDVCHKTWITGRSTTQLWHKCVAPRRRGFYDYDRETDRRQWARTLLGEAIADAVDEEDQLRRL